MRGACGEIAPSVRWRGIMNALGLSRKEWVFNVLGLLVLLALGVVG
jgi:hypothetical protein